MAAAVAAADEDGYWAARNAARKIWDRWFAEAPEAQQIRDLAAEQRTRALTILDRMIDPKAAA